MTNNIQIPTENDRFKLTKEYLGAGSFGEVYKAMNIVNNEMAAVKVITCHDFQAVGREVSILSLLNKCEQLEKKQKQSKKFNPVLRLLGTYRDYNQFYIITQYYGVSLNNLIKQISSCSLLKALKIFKSVLTAIAPLRKCKILHRDIKPQNILIFYNKETQSFYSKMCDFGLAIQESEKQSTFCNNRVGTLIYQSPEVIKLKQYSQKSQIWSLGILLYSLIYKRLPYQQHIYFKPETLYNQIFSKHIQFRQIPFQIAKIGQKCLANCSKKRIQFTQLLQEVDKVIEQFKCIQNKYNALKQLKKQNKVLTIDKDKEYANKVEFAQSTDISIQTCSNEQSHMTNKKQQIYEVDEFNSQFMMRLQKMYIEAKQRIVNLKKPKKVELQLLKICESVEVQNGQKQFVNFFSPTILNTLILNIKKIKLICEYCEDEKQISFNLKQFMLADTLLNLYEISSNPHSNINGIKFAQKIKMLDQHLSYNGQSKTMKYYKELRIKIINFSVK